MPPFIFRKSIENVLKIERVKNILTKVTLQRKIGYYIALRILILDMPKLNDLEIYDFSFKNLSKFCHICPLELIMPHISTENSLTLNNFKSLKKLILYNCELDSDTFNLFEDPNIRKSLEILIIENNKISLDQAELIAKFKNLQELRMIEVTFDNETSFLKILESKGLHKTITELTLDEIYFEKNIDFSSSRRFIRPEIARQITDFHNLRKLHLNIYIDISSIKEILSSPNLQKTILVLDIFFYHPNIDLKLISQFQGIENLTVGGIKISAGSLKNLLDNPNLRVSLKEFNLFPKEWSAESFLGFSYFKSTMKLDLRLCGLTLNAIDDILKCESLQKSIKDLNLSFCEGASDCCWEMLANFCELEYLNLEGNKMQTKSLAKILKCKNLLNGLKELNISENYEISNENAALFSNFRSLEILKISNSELSPDVAFKILKCKNLKKSIRLLELDGNKNIAIRHIKKISTFYHLEILSLDNCDLNFKDLLPIFESEKLKSSLKIIYLRENEKLKSISLLKDMFERCRIKMYHDMELEKRISKFEIRDHGYFWK